MRTGAKLVIGLLVLAMALAVGLRLYFASFESETEVTRQSAADARVGIGLSQEGRKLLSEEEQTELNSLYEGALQSLPRDEQQRFFALAQKGASATDQELGDSWRLMQKALETLPQERRDRLFALVGKAVQLAQQKAETEKPPEAK